MLSGIFPPDINIFRELFRYYYYYTKNIDNTCDNLRGVSLSTISHKLITKTQQFYELKNIHLRTKQQAKQDINDVCIQLFQQRLDNSTDFDKINLLSIQVYYQSKFLRQIYRFDRLSQKLIFQFLSGRYTPEFSYSYLEYVDSVCPLCKQQFQQDHIFQCNNQIVKMTIQNCFLSYSLQNFSRKCDWESIQCIRRFVYRIYRCFQKSIQEFQN
eukprot:TRINITY_DN2890_c1_g1_i2.p1 TRINITY_DN2890_c1_g1~~TRINITY_DN2890_c1_g1_i2.p1  ORF type:complete len:231 (+),score=-21.09 TRINITY_DN2890_c1_g1_i2:56-694(+)